MLLSGRNKHDDSTLHCQLNKHLFILVITDSPLCRACMEADETPTHVLLRCRGVAEQRAAYLGSPTSLPEELGDPAAWSDSAGSRTSGTTYNGRFRPTEKVRDAGWDSNSLSAVEILPTGLSPRSLHYVLLFTSWIRQDLGHKAKCLCITVNKPPAVFTSIAEPSRQAARNIKRDSVKECSRAMYLIKRY
ncbi:jg24427 [Pararge aegeria aegeria]|uniref:Jg24427 protein n=1 Tax=Pararge aegeria aegeria TaxID=348720 RepID=A0A8S4S0D4_9NEOP|nr:jg24427 [Pararge aegeria aegeria]